MHTATNGHCCDRTFGWDGGWHTETRVKRLILSHAPLSEALGTFKACMTNMVLGFGCMSRHVSKRAEAETDDAARALRDAVRRARRRLDRFFFVGLTERWRESICLFNLKLTGERYVTWQQLKNCRPTPPKANVTPPDPHGLPDDPLDRALYRHARLRFERELVDHGITEDACVVRGPELAIGCAPVLKPRMTIRLYM